MNGKRKWGLRLAALLFGLLTAGILLLSGMDSAKAPTEGVMDARQARAGAEETEKLQAGAVLEQTMRFQRCGHSVSRRREAEEDEAGLNFQAFSEKYGDWEIRDFSARNVVMEKEPDLFCPMHEVLSAGDSGEIVLTNNRYGDGMAVEKVYSTTLSQVAEEKRAPLIAGIGFDSREEAEKWLSEATE